jgi:hypothetical protein
MTDFETKHNELYLEELNHIISAVKQQSLIELDCFEYYNTKKIKQLISAINLNNKDNVIKILNILVKQCAKGNLEEILSLPIKEDNNGDSLTLRKIMYIMFESEFIDFLLKDLVEENNE